MKTKINKKRLALFALNIFVFLAVSLIFGGAVMTFGAVGVELKGYAWSSNVGWISLNCVNESSCTTTTNGIDYKVSVLDTDSEPKILSGYAWSSNIGWIYFGPDDFDLDDGSHIKIIDAPGEEVDRKWAQYSGTGAFSGWAKALSAISVGTNDWDGWISMSGVVNGVSYGVEASGTKLTGQAWGGDVIGWISFDGDAYGAGTVGNIALTKEAYVDLTVSSPTVLSGGGVTLSWAPGNIDLDIPCTASCTSGTCATWTDTIDKSTGGGNESNVGPITADTVFALSCTDGDGGLVQGSVEVLAEDPPSSFTVDFAETNNNYVVNIGTAVDLNWLAQSPPNTITSCAGICGYGSCDSWVGAKSESGTYSSALSDPIEENTKFVLTCTDSLNETKTANVIIGLAQGFSVDFPPAESTDNYVTATVIEDDTTSSQTQILIDSTPSFNSPVEISIVSFTVEGTTVSDPGFTFNFSGVDENGDPVDIVGADFGDTFILYPSSFSSGVTLTINIPAGTIDPGKQYAFTVQAEGGGYIRNGVVHLNVTRVERTIIEI